MLGILLPIVPCSEISFGNIAKCCGLRRSSDVTSKINNEVHIFSHQSGGLNSRDGLFGRHLFTLRMTSRGNLIHIDESHETL